MSLGKVTKTDKMDIYVQCVGVMKRDRKVKSHQLDIVTDLPYEDVDLSEYSERAKIIVRSRMKTLERCSIVLSPWTQVDEEGYGYSMKEVRLMDARFKRLAIEVSL